jgi:hypothetical protein
MARTHCTARKCTGRLPVGQLAPQNVPRPQESQPDIPQEASPEEEPFEILLEVPESPTAQDSPAEEQQQPGDHNTKDKTNEEHPPLSDTEAEKMYRDADKVESFGTESPILTGRLWALLEHLGITTAPRYRIKEVPCLGRVEFKAIIEIFFGSRVLYRHKGPAFRTSRSDAVADAAWQAITSWVCSNKSYSRMVDGQASDLYASDTDTWTATSLVQSSSKEPTVSSHSPFGSRSRSESPESVTMWC